MWTGLNGNGFPLSARGRFRGQRDGTSRFEIDRSARSALQQGVCQNGARFVLNISQRTLSGQGLPQRNQPRTTTTTAVQQSASAERTAGAGSATAVYIP